ncbi:MAG: hypothetical protein HT580_09380 [Dechloromonas sp.]|nr:MAG: hypothetical protein HT580_09380 [Dechloromonas sp.]
MPSPILARADALMQRRRPTSPEPDDVPLLTDAISPEDDLPLLVDIETPAPVAESRLADETQIEAGAANFPLSEAAAHPEPPAESAPSLAFEGEMLDIIALNWRGGSMSGWLPNSPTSSKAPFANFWPSRKS